ncbi:MAG: peptide deformylase, partial [Oscillospiraceae bacterium]|nr:peptide deformylase [Oscillospiraceae bacterium]
MALRRILKNGDPALRKISRGVTDINPRILTILSDMAETMYDADGCGLAAPQIGILRRLVVIDTGDGLLELINPEIIEQSDELEKSEGCLSIPGQRGFVVRPQKVTYRAMNRNGEIIERRAEGLAAVAVCHEIDHL